MGIFTDFLNSRPMTGESERRARRELEALQDQGDADAPSGFTGRTGWAILKTLGLISISAPPTQGQLIEFLIRDVDYFNSPISPGTVKIIINQIAIDDDNKNLERNLLVRLDLGPTKPDEDTFDVVSSITASSAITSVRPPPVFPASAAERSIPVDDYNAANLGVSDGADVDTWNSDAGTDFMTKVNNDIFAPFSPTFEAAAFNGLGGIIFDQNTQPDDGDIVRYETNDSIQPFADRTGTFVVVWEPRVSLPGAHTLIRTSIADSQSQFAVSTDTRVTRPFLVIMGTVGAVETPAADLPLNNPQLFLWWRDDDRIEFRRNGIAKSGITLTGNPAPTSPSNMRLFGATSEANSLSGAIARVLRWDRILTNQEQLDIEAEMTGLYF